MGNDALSPFAQTAKGLARNPFRTVALFVVRAWRIGAR